MHFPDLIIGPINRPFRQGEVYWCEIVKRAGDGYVRDRWLFNKANNMGEASDTRNSLANKAKVQRLSVKFVSSVKGLRRWEGTKVVSKRAPCLIGKAIV